MSHSVTLARLLAAVIASIAALALLAPTASAAVPAPGYGQFAGCPSPEEDPDVDGCLNSAITGGHFKMGSKTVPISKPITLSGGFGEGLVDFTANSKGGLTPVKQLVPGGVIGLTGLDWLVNFLGVEELKLYAVTELAGTPILSQDFSVTLPIKVRLVNPVLGNSCYVGSSSNPIVLNLTTGTTSPPPPNKPISGVQPEFNFDEELFILHLDNGTYVDNSFAAPGASGCKLTLLGVLPINLNGLVNLQAGLPSPAGTNETKQDFDLEIVPSMFVYP